MHRLLQPDQHESHGRDVLRSQSARDDGADVLVAIPVECDPPSIERERSRADDRHVDVLSVGWFVVRAVPAWQSIVVGRCVALCRHSVTLVAGLWRFLILVMLKNAVQQYETVNVYCSTSTVCALETGKPSAKTQHSRAVE
mmetsp:Transcript_10602/g.29230  ORF Transcript_10602/g.29230 Transcript_10602/m.29230 type:complete len:141 (+) Transcript_10602:915-1337(+)